MEKQTCYWTARFFWQYPSQSEGFYVLSSVLERDDLSHQQRMMIAKTLAHLIHLLHDKMIFQQDLKLDDILLDESRMVIFHLNHYANLPMQYTEILLAVKIENFID